MFLTRGIVQTLGISADSTTDAIISVFAGIGHVILGDSLVVFLIFLAKQIIGQNKVDKSSGKNRLSVDGSSVVRTRRPRYGNRL